MAQVADARADGLIVSAASSVRRTTVLSGLAESWRLTSSPARKRSGDL
jgi:hypothetical protein